jgi:hypothetical protein
MTIVTRGCSSAYQSTRAHRGVVVFTVIQLRSCEIVAVHLPTHSELLHRQRV